MRFTVNRMLSTIGFDEACRNCFAEPESPEEIRSAAWGPSNGTSCAGSPERCCFDQILHGFRGEEKVFCPLIACAAKWYGCQKPRKNQQLDDCQFSSREFESKPESSLFFPSACLRARRATLARRLFRSAAVSRPFECSRRPLLGRRLSGLIAIVIERSRARGVAPVRFHGLSLGLG